MGVFDSCRPRGGMVCLVRENRVVFLDARRMGFGILFWVFWGGVGVLWDFFSVREREVGGEWMGLV